MPQRLHGVSGSDFVLGFFALLGCSSFEGGQCTVELFSLDRRVACLITNC